MEFYYYNKYDRHNKVNYYQIKKYEKKNIYFIGSGWGCLSFIKYINTNKYNVNVISKDKNFLYTPLLANNIKNDIDLEIDIKKINNNVSFEENEVIDIDFENNHVITKDKQYLKYDYLILSHCSVINTFDIEGVNENCYFLKNNEDSEIIKNKLNILKKIFFS